MTRRTFALSLAGAASITSATYSAQAETAKDRGRRLAEKIILALGGDAFRNMRTRTEIGRAYSFYRDQLTGLAVARIYTKYEGAAGNSGVREVQRQVFGKKLDDAVLFMANDAYEVTYRGAKPLPEDRVKQFRETTLRDVFYILHERMTEAGLEFEDAGNDVVENQTVASLDIFDAENRQVRVWVNATSLLPVKQRFRRWDPIINDWREEVTRYSKYREVNNGVMWPYATARERDTEKIFEMYAEKVTIDEAVADNMFQLPTGVKLLK